MTGTPRRGRRVTSATMGLAIAGALFTGYGAAGFPTAFAATPATPATSATSAMSATSMMARHEPHCSQTQREIALYTAMRQLWADHMQWTYATVDAYFHNQQALQPTLDRLLQNQKDLGAAIVPFYGKAAGEELAALLTTHIKDAVPVLAAAQAGDKTALDQALANWYANAKQIADFLSAANPRNWPTSATEPMLRTHITQTTVYSVDLLKGDYAKSITDFGKAYRHMMMMSDILSKGLIAQFPGKFCG